MKPSAIISITLLAVLLLSFGALAHVPLSARGNDNITSALHISDAAKSFAIYGRLDSGEVHYYRLDMQKGDIISLSLFVSASPKELDFRPGMVLYGPGIKSEGPLPQGLAFPPEKASGAMTIPGTRAESATYEPFAPSSFVQMANVSLSAPQTASFIVAVFSGNTSGHYGLATGYREEFSFMERITAPIQLISVYIWEGQSPGLVLTPFIAAEIIGLLVFYWGRRTAYRMAGTLGGFLFLATPASVFMQMVFSLTRAPFGPDVYITLVIAVFHVLLGVAAIRLAGGEAGILHRVLLAVLGTMALLAGSGLILGPLLAIAGSLLPSRKLPNLADHMKRDIRFERP
ncbi:Uncharacterised protein [uncultured archaeon]|nr:Uncharacterised protein [uncultured archaeon]